MNGSVSGMIRSFSLLVFFFIYFFAIFFRNVVASRSKERKSMDVFSASQSMHYHIPAAAAADAHAKRGVDDNRGQR